MSIQRFPSKIEPNFDGGLLDASKLQGGVRVVKSKTARNAIPYLYRTLTATETTLCFVENDLIIYKLINNPTTIGTADSDWEQVILMGISTFQPVGVWDSANTDPILQDVDADGRNGEFYFVINTATPTEVTIPGLFEGDGTTVVDGNLIVSVGVRWVVVANSATWDALSKPQVITDYVNGIVQAHLHVADDITDLAALLDEKYDIGDTADHTIPFDSVPDTAIIELEFLKAFYFNKTELIDLIEYKAFTDLIDTPSSYSGEQNKFIRVNSSEDGLEFFTIDLASVLAMGNDADGLAIVNMADPTNPQDADTQAARDAAITSSVNALLDGVASDGNTLNKLRNLITSLGEFAGNHDASTTLLPTTGTGISGAIDKGDYWYITVPGTISGLGDLAIGDVLFARISGASVAADFFYLPFADLTPNSSESLSGKIEIATQTETNTGTDDVRAVTPLKLATYISTELGNVDNTSDVNKPVSTAQAAADLVAENNAKTYADSLVVGLWDDRGSFNASVNAYPTTGGSGSGGSIIKGDIWTINVAGTLPTGLVVEPGDTVRALVDTPGNTQTNWSIQQNNIGYVPENTANKDTSGGYVGLSGWSITFRNLANTFTSLLQNAATAARTYIFPDKDITVAGVQDTVRYGVCAGTDTYTVTFANPAFTAWAVGQLFCLQFTNANTSTTPSVNPNGVGAKTIVKRNSNALVANDIASGQFYNCVYDGTNLRILGVANTAILNDVKIQNQIQSGKKVLCYIDTDGTIKKVAEAEYDSTLKKWTFTAADVLSSNSSVAWQNSNLDSILELFNNQVAKFGGDSTILEVEDGTNSGNAYVWFPVFSSGAGIGFRFVDKNQNDYLSFRSKTGDKAIIFGQKIEKSFNQSDKIVEDQYSLILPNTTADYNHVLFEFTLADDDHYEIKVSHNDATALSTDGAYSITSLGIDSADVRKIASTNIEGNTRINSQSRIPDTIQSGGFNWQLDTTNQKIQYCFRNGTSGQNKNYSIFLQVAYMKRVTPG